MTLGGELVVEGLVGVKAAVGPLGGLVAWVYSKEAA